MFCKCGVSCLWPRGWTHTQPTSQLTHARSEFQARGTMGSRASTATRTLWLVISPARRPLGSLFPPPWSRKDTGQIVNYFENGRRKASTRVFLSPSPFLASHLSRDTRETQAGLTLAAEVTTPGPPTSSTGDWTTWAALETH